jgi:hypothetical protein
METNDIPNTEVSDWVPMTNPVHLAVLGKAGEELGELISAKDRCIIQGLDGIDPDSGKVNRDWLTDEVADVAAMLLHIARRFNLDSYAIEERKQRKYVYKGKWFDKLQRDLDANVADIKSLFSKCLAIQYSDTTVCSACHLMWDTNDTAPPACPRMETKKRLQREINYVMLLDYPVETIKLMAEQNPNLYIVPFYIRMYGAMGKTSGAMEDVDTWGNIRNVFKPQLLDMSKCPPMGSWQDLARPVVENLFSGLGNLKEMRIPPLVQSPPTEPPPWELPSKPAEVPETVEWYVGAYDARVGFNRMRFQYTNHLGVKAQREVRPIKVWFGSTPYHPTSRALLKAYDYDRQGERDFEMGQMREVHWVGASENMRD